LDDDDFINENRNKFDSGFMVQFIIKGLSGQQSAVGTQEMFNDSIFGYKRPYYLNN
jgi:LPS-assembly protein